jgi:hypothetical protein
MAFFSALLNRGAVERLEEKEERVVRRKRTRGRRRRRRRKGSRASRGEDVGGNRCMDLKSISPSRRGTTRRPMWGADKTGFGAVVEVEVEEAWGRGGDAGAGGKGGKSSSSSWSSSWGEGGRGSAWGQSAMEETQVLLCLLGCV